MVERRPIADMAGQGGGLAAVIADLCGQLLAGVDLAAGDDDPGAAFGQTQAHGPAQATAAAGHQHHPAGDGEQRIGHCANRRARESNWSTTKPKNSWCGLRDSPRRYFVYDASSTIASFQALNAWYQSNPDRSRPVAAA